MCGCPIAWSSRLQRSIAESTAEVEFKAINESAHELFFIYRLTEELLYHVQYPITLYEDNIAAITQCLTTASKGRIKHLELQYFKVTEHVK